MAIAQHDLEYYFDTAHELAERVAAQADQIDSERQIPAELAGQESQHISLDGRFESKANAQQQLAELLRTLGLSAQVGVAIATWADGYSSENEYWFSIAEEKITHSNHQNADAQKKIKDLKIQRQRLEDDLGTMTKKVYKNHDEQCNHTDHSTNLHLYRLMTTDKRWKHC